ncbi:MAG TPA: malto-oligosyltrehalose synthase, partial [Thermoanaerobaculia bacterium]|nr:malto-oligosyltrehalose synthase [Thermoanaerobaculia bacterium]
MSTVPPRVRPRHLPTATYRLQIEPGQTLTAAAERVPYLHRLGVTDLYSSPLSEARPGSAHGYDVTDPTRVREELGGEEALRALAVELAEHGMGLVLDIVPNHMAASVENPWWRDVLTRGAASPWARFFDIDWESEAVGRGRVLLPVLGASFGEELEGGALRLGREGDEVVVRYHELVLPVRSARDLQALSDDAGRPDPDLLDAILAEQPYRLALWRLASEIVNYRRFFDISDLVGLRVEDEVVFAETHRLFLRLAGEGLVTGLRIDHIDGLYDPREYLERLQAALAQAGGEGGSAGEAPFYVVVEKILAGEEDLPPEWPVAGTTGYDALNALTGLFVDPHGLATLDRVYARYTGLTEGFEEVRYRRKHQALQELFAGELRSLGRHLAALAAADRHARDLPPSELARVLLEVTACLPVYRTYVDDDGPSGQDRELLARALADARARLAPRPLTAAAFAFLERVLTVDPSSAGESEQEVAAGWLHFTARWQQLTGPAMAKGLEDTALYVYNRLISLNAVGGEPEGIDPPGDAAAYHRRNAQRREQWPYAMTASSTHDAKRSEDVRSRVNVLSELAEGWRERVERWTAWNRGKKRSVRGRLVPDANEEIFLYQTLVGAWPLRDPEEARFAERLEAYLVKAAREAKVHTSWLEPDAEYEEALVAFVRALLDPGPNRFLDELLGFHALVAFYGAWGSLAQVVLQVASPGVPDFYQGTELWNFSLVDPDNRRPVDWDLRRRLLDE